MVRSEPHSQTLFWLVPLNDGAIAVLNHPGNQYLVSLLPEPNLEQTVGIEIGFHVGSASRNTLATLGRSGADIVVEGTSISRIQCSFEISEEFGSVLLYDRSNSQSTQALGEDAIPFEPGRIRRIAVTRYVNTFIGMGGAGSDLVQFELKWHQPKLNPKNLVDSRVLDNPRLARTIDETPTIAPSRRITRIHTPRDREQKTRWAKQFELGSGRFGRVLSTIDVDKGRIMAVKVIQRPTSDFEQNLWISLKREIEALAHLSHPHIVEYIGHQLVDERLEIFTELKEGNVEHLMRRGTFKQPSGGPIKVLLHHVLQAIDFLAYKKVVHRDIKPANILFTETSPTTYLFQLTDFGLCNAVENASSFAGSPIFMAPEILLGGGRFQTSKVDVWSLFVTLAFVLDVNGYQRRKMISHKQIINEAVQAAEGLPMSPLKDMVVEDPSQRASAAELLRNLFDGVGVTTTAEEVQLSSRQPYGSRARGSHPLGRPATNPVPTQRAPPRSAKVEEPTRRTKSIGNMKRSAGKPRKSTTSLVHLEEQVGSCILGRRKREQLEDR